MDLPFAPQDVSPLLLDWYGREGRELPWRQTRDPYRIWLSEILLQQTTVAAVIPRYLRLLEQFPDVNALAAVEVETVIEAWAGLGYYRRARNLHAAARMVVVELDGSFPDTLDGLQALPGIGRSTAGAILSIAFNKPAPILDGNVRRVLCRLFALQEPARSSSAEKKLWAWAEALTPPDRAHDYAQAIMDLGATLCTPSRPRCSECPLKELCQGFKLGLQDELPVSGTRKPVPTVCQVAVMVNCKGRVLLLRRPLDGMLGGLWEFPGTEMLFEEKPEAAAGRLLADLAVPSKPKSVGLVRHAYSHFKLDLHLFRVEADRPAVVNEGESEWVPVEELAGRALHGAHKKALPYFDTSIKISSTESV